MQFQGLDQSVPFTQQLTGAGREPVVLLNIFQVELDQVDAFLAAWTDDAHFMRAQPGCLSTQMHRGVAGSGLFVNYAVWESVQAFRRAFGSPEFQSKLGGYPGGTTASACLLRKIAVEGICAA